MLRQSHLGIAATLLIAAGFPASAANLCVHPGGQMGCYGKIADAVAAATPGTTIRVDEGTYKEDVVITKSLSLSGAGRGRSIIDATGLANGIFVNGIDHAGLGKVLIAGFTVKNANFEGILVANASQVTVWNNEIVHNDLSLDITKNMCPGIPAFETGEDFDCGEGLHFLGADHSTAVHNLVAHNSGGILLSDDTAPVSDIVITGNVVRDNTFECGITLASHNPMTGVFHNTVSDNESLRNGTVTSEGAGVGLFAAGPGMKTSGNLVVHNRIRDNGLPGVAMHAHAPTGELNDNVILGNEISGNAADSGDAATPGPTGINVFAAGPITGTMILDNLIRNEQVDVAVNTPADVQAHLNSLLDQTGIQNLGTGTVNATENWWNCPDGPSATGCAKAVGPGIWFTPWLRWPFAVPDRDRH